ncbi:hypothetical protein ACWOQH_000609 [Vibrio parahaemolyticus]
MDTLNSFLRLVEEGKSNINTGFSLVASENQLSEFAASFLNCEFYGRYSFDSDSTWGATSFPNGRSISAIRNEITHPILARLSKARYVNTKPISGISCLTVVISALCPEGSSVLVLPEKLGGHPSTKYIIRKLGLKVYEIPVSESNEIDIDKLLQLFKRMAVKLIYLDHSNGKSEIDIPLLKMVMNDAEKNIHIHYDTSHFNALVLGGALSNPLVSGGDSFGGSLHKSFSGPHKAFIATNNRTVIDRVNYCSDRFISHEHPNDFLAMTASLLEFDECDGCEYANKMVENGQQLEAALMNMGGESFESSFIPTRTHQLHLSNFRGRSLHEVFNMWVNNSIITNYFTSFLGKNISAIRIGVNEITKLGFDYQGISDLSEAMTYSADGNYKRAKEIIVELKKIYFKPRYCYDAYKR